MTDGQGKAMSTNLVLTENSSLSQSTINDMVNTYLGITDYQLYPDPNNTYINHIDCWAKLLDVDKVLIRSVPTNHPQYSAIEAVVAQWQTKLSSYGTPYKIFRVNTSNDEPYTNSFIFNKHIYVPLMGTANDAAALLAYQNAMPGYTVTGYSYSNFESTDAIHCRVNTIFDNQMISVKHFPPVPSSVLQTLTFNVNIAHTNALNQSGTYISWKTGKNGIWQNSNLSLQSNGNWLINLTAPVIGDTLFYWISATDVTNRNVTLPLCASQDPFMLIGVYVPAINQPQVQLQIQDNNVRISWNVVPYANNYVIYAADTPQGSFLPVGSTSETYWETSLIEEKKFFKIIAQRVVR